MRILHTSDWHLGQFFYSKSRAYEHQKFIDWLLQQVDTRQIDAVIIAGDLFDTGTPPSYARELYNQFVVAMHQRQCQLLVLAGNHDSVAMLNESSELLSYLNTQVISQATEDLESQVKTLWTATGEPGAIVCSVPFLRPRDLLQSQAGQSADEKSKELGLAIRDHYQSLYTLAKQKSAAADNPLPIIATGHLTAMGVKSSESVRDIYIGSLEAFPAQYFPAADYIALGHIHRPQKVGGSEHIRYSGSPIPLSFDELSSQKQVVLVEFTGTTPQTTPLDVPIFQPMQHLKGDLAAIEAQLKVLPETELSCWLSIEVELDDYLSDLQNRIQALVKGLNVEVLLLKRARKRYQGKLETQQKETLQELTPVEVFARRLQLEQFDAEESNTGITRIQQQFNTIMHEVQEEQGLPLTPLQVEAEKAAASEADMPTDLISGDLLTGLVDDNDEALIEAAKTIAPDTDFDTKKSTASKTVVGPANEQTIDKNPADQHDLFSQPEESA